MKNNIREIRKDLGWTQHALAKKAGTSIDQISKLERSQRGLTLDWMGRLSKALGCTSGALIPGERSDVPIIGYIGSGGIVNLYDASGDINRMPIPPGVKQSQTLAALVVKGDSMFPMFKDGWHICYDEKSSGEVTLALCANKLCVVKVVGGDTVVREVRRGYSDNKYNLHGCGSGMTEDKSLEYASKVLVIIPN